MNLVVSVLNWRWIPKKSRNRDSPLLRSYLQSTKHPTTLAKHKPSNIDANGGYREDAESELRHQFDQRDSAKNTSCSCRNTFPSPSPSWDLGALWKEKLCHTITSPHTPSANCETTKHNSPLRAKHHSSRSSKLIPWTQRILQFSNNTLAVSYFVRSLREKKPRNNRAESAIGAVHYVVGEHLIWEWNAHYKGLSRIRALEAHAAKGDVTVVVTPRGGNITPAIAVTIIRLPEDRVTPVAVPFNWRIYGLSSFRVPSHLNLESYWREGESTRHSCSWERWPRNDRVRNCCSHRATPLGVEPSTGVTIMEQGNLAGITIR